MSVSVKRSQLEGNGLFSDRGVPCGTLLIVVQGRAVEQPIWHINHSCAPNCVVQGIHVFAARDIEAGEELTINYQHINFGVKPLRFDCVCGQPLCKGDIKL